MLDYRTRTQRLIGPEKMERLKKSAVLVFGAGGVGSYVIEALARSGLGRVDIVDGDRVSVTNLNRQLIALETTIGQQKAELARDRIRSIRSDLASQSFPLFFTKETGDLLDFTRYDYIVDAIDTVTAKLEIIRRAKLAQVPVISAMGTGNKLNPMAFQIADIAKTSICPLARVMRRELKRMGLTDVKVLFSTEEALRPEAADPAEGRLEKNDPNAASSEAYCPEKIPPEVKGTAGRPVPGSVPFVPSVAGLLIAAEVFNDLCRNEGR